MRNLLTLFLLAWTATAADPIPPAEYKERRASLLKELKESVVILFGNNEGDDLHTGFFQEPNFFYLTGWTEPGAVLVMTPSAEVLLIPRRDTEKEKWTGRKASAADSDIAKVTGFETVIDTGKLESSIAQWLEQGSQVYTLPKTEGGARLARLLPLRDLLDASLPLGRLRAVKSKAEIALIQHSTDVTLDAHRAAWKRIKPGVKEYQVASTMSGVYFDRGCERHAYAPIVGAGPNAATLHYSKNNRTMDSGQLVLMDVAAECSMYATDITRTVPVNGKFTARQRELYEVVLGAQKAAIAAIKPGVMMGNARTKIGLHKIAMDYIDSHGKDLHGKSLGQYFTHGLGHHVGLDVHDANDPALPLAANMVITIEPGIYIPEENIGIRIEDMLLVTETGSKLMSSGLPREMDEIQRSMTP